MQSTHLTRAPLRGSPPTVYRGGAACPIPNKKNTGNKRKTQQRKKQKTNTKLNRENKTKMESLTRGGENPIPKQKKQGEKNITKNPLQLARGGANTHCL